MTGRLGYFANWLELVLTVAAMLVLFAAVGVLVGEGLILNGQSNQATDANRGRAQVCRIVVAIGLPPDDICLTPAVERYYDPRIPLKTTGANTAAQNLNVLCALAVKLQVVVPDCKGP